MSSTASPSGLGRGERSVAWLLTGPIGRVVAFVGDLGAYWLRGARRRMATRR